ncbi:unnamed protein product [Miscanthus lutarioriparius]|uniref:Uncharacterized protein n=1 Tax=Miscanthus lutarioriparius TaxID=422564 RepID=A0A811M6G2_9POAL|nr:unnamed protein product [Miscanthus lutarioriparius]
MPVVKKICPPPLHGAPAISAAADFLGTSAAADDMAAARRFRSFSSWNSSLTMAWYRHSMLQKARSPRYMKMSSPSSGRRHMSQHDRNSATRNAAPPTPPGRADAGTQPLPPHRLVAHRPLHPSSDTSSRAARRGMDTLGTANAAG